jgi:hypothetical protein
MMLTRSLLATTAALTAALTLSTTAPAAAQDVQYENVTKLDFPGAMGTAMRLAARMGGGSLETVEKVSIKGNRMRTDIEKQSSILDLDARRMISIDHDARTYMVMTFDEMVARAQEAGAAMQNEQQRRQVSNNPQAEGQVTFRFAVEDARERERIAGYSADRFFLTMEAEGEHVPENAQAGAEREKTGTLVVLTEMWASKEVPVFGARSSFDQVSAQEYAGASAAIMQAMAAAYADNPQLQVAFEQSTREAAKIEGMPVRTIVRFVSVAPEKTFDRQLAVDPKPQGPGVGAQAARAGLGRLARAATGARPQEQEQQAAQQELTQATFMTVTSEIRNIATRSLDARLFEPPAGYREVRP